MALSPATQSATLLSFPRADARSILGQCLKRHRLSEALANGLLHEVAKFSDVAVDAALAFALAQRMSHEPIDIQASNAILLVGPEGAGKSAVAAKIAYRATLIGRKTQLYSAQDGLRLLRTRANDPKNLVIMEAAGFNPLNTRAASAFSALSEIEAVQTIGVLSAVNDAEDISDIVRAFRLRRVIVTNMDRTRRLGAALAAMTSGAQLAHVTYGAHAQDPLEQLEPGRLAYLLLECDHY